MDFQACIADQLRRHPSMTPQDLVKLCYQAAFGADHLLLDRERALRYLEREFDETVYGGEPLFELIAPHLCRVNLGAWKDKGLGCSLLFALFVCSCSAFGEGKDTLRSYLALVGETLDTLDAPFDRAQWEDYCRSYEAAGMPAMHHSEVYRAAEHPAYRIVRSEWLPMIPLWEEMVAQGKDPMKGISLTEPETDRLRVLLREQVINEVKE